VNPGRITHLQEGQYVHDQTHVVYWMQQSQRVHFNHALNHAINLANQWNLPLLVFFGLTSNYPDANERHFAFMLEGLQEVKAILEHFHITFVMKLKSPELGVIDYLEHAHALVMDEGYLKHQKSWRKHVLDQAQEKFPNLRVDVVDTDAIVPVKVVSDKAEYGAYTLRPKIMRLYPSYRDFTRINIINNQHPINEESDVDLSNIDDVLKQLHIDTSVSRSSFYRGGFQEASKLFSMFITQKSSHYLESNDPSTDYTSLMSMYIHFGQISTLDILERIFLAHDHGQLDGQVLDAYIEQLLVRRELALNYVTYVKGYDRFETITEPWAYMTMNEHLQDQRPYLYTKQELEYSHTHDPYFNAAMKEMRDTGYMHNYMRMYWAKKIIEWMPTYQEAYETTISLNNKYFIDGRDPNSYASVAWVYGKHDRAWTERAVFGKLRYMNEQGLLRKFNIKGYVDKVNQGSKKP
jgi:deoxyribodipyrimidine photo-lyase